MRRSNAKVGDLVVFTTWHLREGKKKRVTRKIVEIDLPNKILGVRMFGWNPFYLGQKGDIIHKFIKALKKKTA